MAIFLWPITMTTIKQLISSSLRRVPTANRFVRLIQRKYVAHGPGYPQWRQLLEKDSSLWKEALDSAKPGIPILFANSIGANLAGMALESALAVALTLRGAHVRILLCDGVLPACMDCDVTWYPNQRHFVQHGPRLDLCRTCHDPALKMFRDLGLSVERYSDFLTDEDYATVENITDSLTLSDMASYTYEKIPVGEHAMAGALRFFARGDLKGEPYAEPVLRRYLRAGLLTCIAMRNLLKRYKVECVVLQHGIYVPQGPIVQVAHQENIRVVTWNPAYRKGCFLFSHDDTYHHTLLSEPVSTWETMKWNPERERVLMDYLYSRRSGIHDWIWFHEAPNEDIGSIVTELGIDVSKPCIGLLTNVMWDAQLHYPANAFPDMRTWLIETIRYFQTKPELQLLIRVHPAEIRGTLPSRQPIMEEIMDVYPALPSNVFIIPPESSISTYAVMSYCQTIIIYGTKMGVELISLGLPVVAAGEAWVRQKGLTVDVHTREEYFQILDQLPLSKLDDTTVLRARKYAYHFFFRRMIPLEFFVPGPGRPPYVLQLSSMADMMEGRSQGLDVICNGILYGSPFVMP